jgi:ribosomal protein S27AE
MTHVRTTPHFCAKCGRGVVIEAPENDVNPRCSCGAEVKRPYKRPTMTKLQKDDPRVAEMFNGPAKV